MINIRLEGIEPDKYYSARYLCSTGVFPWKNPITFNQRIQRESIKAVLKPIIEKNAKKNSYKMKGENIIKFVNLLEDGKLEL